MNIILYVFSKKYRYEFNKPYVAHLSESFYQLERALEEIYNSLKVST